MRHFGGNTKIFGSGSRKTPKHFLARAFGARGFLFFILTGGVRKTRVRECGILGECSKICVRERKHFTLFSLAHWVLVGFLFYNSW